MNPDLLYRAGMELFFSTGQLADELGVSQDLIRRLCQAGAIRAEETPGGQYRIPQSERDKLKSMGLPNLPRPLPGDRDRPPADQPRSTGDLPDYVSDKTVAAFDEAYRLKAEVRTAVLERRLEETRDWQRRRERKEVEMKEAEAAAERARKAQEEAAARRASSLREWESYALSRLRYDADPDLRLAVSEAVRTQLGKLDPIPSEDATRRIVNALLEAASRMQDGRKESKAIIKETFEALPWDVRCSTKYQDLHPRALQAITVAVDAVPVEATQELKTAAAQQAAQAVRKEFEHIQSCEELVRDLWAEVRDATADELEGAREGVRKALAALPPTASQQDREKVRDSAIANLRQQIGARRAEQERRKAEEERRYQAMLRLIFLSDYICGELIRLERNGELDALEVQERVEITEALEKKLRPILTEKLVHGPFMNHDDLMKRIGRLVDEHLDDVLEPAD